MGPTVRPWFFSVGLILTYLIGVFPLEVGPGSLSQVILSALMFEKLCASPMEKTKSLGHRAVI